MNRTNDHIRAMMAAAAALAMIASAPAIAAPATDPPAVAPAVNPTGADPATGDDAPPTVTVPYGDLDLATPKGQKKLRARIGRAAMEVCQYDGILRDLNHMALQRNCMRRALALAGNQMASAVRRAGGRMALTQWEPVGRI